MSSDFPGSTSDGVIAEDCSRAIILSEKGDVFPCGGLAAKEKAITESRTETISLMIGS